ncbi:MAG: glycosyltransferase family 4 protein [Candidatus Sumerlaeales bacterium]|nr:glycosyltransferase family 4 protein [Candidatus Sumerlaeales bacterium]
MIHNTQIIQVVPTLVSGDAISNYALALNKFCEDENILSLIIANRTAKDLPCKTYPLASLDSLIGQHGDKTVLLYHHSLGDETVDALVASPSVLHIKRLMYYHNITPPHLLDPSSALASRAWLGIRQLDVLVQFFGEKGFAASAYSAQDLITHKWKHVEILPYMVSQNFVSLLTKAALHRKPFNIMTESPTLLYVGRITKHKGLESLIEVLSLIKRQKPFTQCKLILAGNTQLDPDYYQSLVKLCQEHWGTKYEDSVCFVGQQDMNGLAHYYSSSHLLVTASRHEGFCMPLVEAMFASLPIVAMNFGAIGETLKGGTGLVVDSNDCSVFAEACITVLSDVTLQQKIISAQQNARNRFTVDVQKTIMLKALEL